MDVGDDDDEGPEGADGDYGAAGEAGDEDEHEEDKEGAKPEDGGACPEEFPGAAGVVDEVAVF